MDLSQKSSGRNRSRAAEIALIFLLIGVSVFFGSFVGLKMYQRQIFGLRSPKHTENIRRTDSLKKEESVEQKEKNISQHKQEKNKKSIFSFFRRFGREKTNPKFYDKTPPKIRYKIIYSKVSLKGCVNPRARLVIRVWDKNGIAGIYYRRKGEKWRRYKRSVPLKKMAVRKEGVIYFKAIDKAGNESAVKSFPYKIDSTPPRFPRFDLGELISRRKRVYFLKRKRIIIPPLEKGARLYYKIQNLNKRRRKRSRYQRIFSGDYIPITEDGTHRLTLKIADDVGNFIRKTYYIKTDRSPPKSTIQVNTD